MSLSKDVTSYFQKFKYVHYAITHLYSLRTSSTIHVPTIQHSSSERIQLHWFIVSAQQSKTETSVWICFVRTNRMIQFRVHEWSGLPEVINKLAYVVLPERMDTLPTLFKFETQIIHSLTFRTYLPGTYEVRYNVKTPITLFKVLCALRTEENVQNVSDNFLRFTGAT